MNPHYPPGHPTGTTTEKVDADCKACGAVWSYTLLTERDTGASYPDPDGADVCPECEGNGKSDSDEDDTAALLDRIARRLPRVHARVAFGRRA